MIQLIRETTAYRRIATDAAAGTSSHAVLVLFSDEPFLRTVLKECAKAFFGAKEGSRLAGLIDEESFADCAFYPAAGEKLTAETAARLIDESALRPVEGDKKLFVIDGFHTVSPLVQNKLLKSLEEPCAGVYFLLGATAEHAVLPTVLSRVKKIAVPPFSEKQVREALERTHAGAEGAAAAAAASGGEYSVAEKLLEGGGEDFALAERLLTEENYAALCREIGDKREKRAFFAALKLLLRDALFYAADQQKYAAMKTRSVKNVADAYSAGA
ncbi:MAG: hypothetical protein K2H43_02690, partial [Clostridia bacterium]|nr:hypothetical protein [Clostridia bacterium]